LWPVGFSNVIKVMAVRYADEPRASTDHLQILTIYVLLGLFIDYIALCN